MLVEANNSMFSKCMLSGMHISSPKENELELQIVNKTDAFYSGRSVRLLVGFIVIWLL